MKWIVVYQGPKPEDKVVIEKPVDVRIPNDHDALLITAMKDGAPVFHRFEPGEWSAIAASQGGGA